ncbi:MAG: hypothetical protein DRQ88_06420 [Epsilonproteobacteria bacterium]|nr:MAG: hypothetical protein DRQ89_04870 [Campylobacterota bacterium]RLA66431.1 MAG: hypothetical protein DRQ88_06420 [Campylobacterota bacterium]
MKFIGLILLFIYSQNVLSQGGRSYDTPQTYDQFKEIQRKTWERQDRYKREDYKRKAADQYLKALDQTLKGMEKVSQDMHNKAKQKNLDMLNKLKLGRGQMKITLYDLKKLKKIKLNIPLGGKDEKYSCFSTKNVPQSFHSVAKEASIGSEIKFELVDFKGADEKLMVSIKRSVKNYNIDTIIEVPKSSYKIYGNLRTGAIRVLNDAKNKDKMMIKSGSEIKFYNCGKQSIELSGDSYGDEEY